MKINFNFLRNLLIAMFAFFIISMTILILGVSKETKYKKPVHQPSATEEDLDDVRAELIRQREERARSR